jgi:hypothetical protein
MVHFSSLDDIIGQGLDKPPGWGYDCRQLMDEPATSTSDRFYFYYYFPRPGDGCFALDQG